MMKSNTAREVEVTCDKCGKELIVNTGIWPELAVAAKLIKGQGWKIVYSKRGFLHICGECLG